MERVTLKNIAEECGVSLMTVSRALDPRHHNRMSTQTRDHILSVVKKLNYSSDPAARRLKRRKTDVLTMIVDKRFLSPASVMDFNPHFDDLSWGIIRGAITQAHVFNYELKLEAVFNEDDIRQILSHLQPQFTDGAIIVAGAANPPLCDHLDSLTIPYITAKYAESQPPPGSYITIDLEPARIAAFECILDTGRKKVAFLGSGRIYNFGNIVDSLRNFYQPRGMFDPELIYSVADIYELRELFARFAGRLPFDTLFCGNDSIADFAIRELQYNRIRVPEDVAVIGQDGNSVYTQPGRSNPATIVCPWSELTATCVSELIKMVEENSSEIVRKSIPATFSRRNTI